MTRRASLEVSDRGPSMLCGHCMPRLRFASCTWVCYEVSVCDATDTYVGEPLVAHGHCKARYESTGKGRDFGESGL